MLCSSGPANLAGIAGFVLALLFFAQLVFVPISARRAGRDGALWFFITFMWLFLTGGLTWMFVLVPASAVVGHVEPGMILFFLLSAAFAFLPLILASRRGPGHGRAPRPRLPRRSSFARRRAARRGLP